MGACCTFTKLLPFDTTSSVLATVQQNDVVYILLCCACLLHQVHQVHQVHQFSYFSLVFSKMVLKIENFDFLHRVYTLLLSPWFKHVRNLSGFKCCRSGMPFSATCTYPNYVEQIRGASRDSQLSSLKTTNMDVIMPLFLRY